MVQEAREWALSVMNFSMSTLTKTSVPDHNEDMASDSQLMGGGSGNG